MSTDIIFTITVWLIVGGIMTIVTNRDSRRERRKHEADERQAARRRARVRVSDDGE